MNFTHLTAFFSRLIRKTKALIHAYTPSAVLVDQLDKAETANAPQKPEFFAYIARSKKTIVAAQRLRFEVFSEEYGAEIDCPLNLDRDRYDSYAHHLVVKEKNTRQIIAYTRLILDKDARDNHGFYSASEFEFLSIDSLAGTVLEVGRTCVHKDYRTGTAINSLWSGIADFCLKHKVDFLIGCASIPLNDPDISIPTIMPYINTTHQLKNACIRPLIAYDMPQDSTLSNDTSPKKMLPPLLKAYLRLGAKIGGEPAWDKAFNCIDLFILLEINAIPPRYYQRFFTRPSERV